MQKVCIFPGQGAQKKGMGQALFDSVPEFIACESQINDLLGYSLRNMCIENPDQLLGQTQVTQPCLFIVNCLHYLAHQQQRAQVFDCYAGHSLGEYNALFAAGAFDLLDGLRLVIKRAELMAKANGGAMAAVVGLSAEQISQVLNSHNFDQLTVANFNSPKQTVISGDSEQIKQAASAFDRAGVRLYKPLAVSAAFHSPFMQNASIEFRQFLAQFEFKPLHSKVLCNVTGGYYPGDVNNKVMGHLLALQVSSSVNWVKNIQAILQQGPAEFVELGPSKVLTRMVKEINDDFINNPIVPITAADVVVDTVADVNGATNPVEPPSLANLKYPGEKLGNRRFKQDYNLRFAYMAGSMYKGIASTDLVVKLVKAGALASFGAGGLPLEQVIAAIKTIKRQVGTKQCFAMNLLANVNDPKAEMSLVDAYIAHDIHLVEASAYMRISDALVKFRLSNVSVDAATNQLVVPNRIIAKVSRPEVAKLFMAPAAQEIVDRLVASGQISAVAASVYHRIPMAQDITVEADSGGHTDQGVAYALMPAMQALKAQYQEQYQYGEQFALRLGAAGGIGSPQAAAAALMLGADYIVTGSINQCTVEAGTSDAAKDLLENINVQDTAYAPAGDMFELGAKVQVLRKGVFFAARANKLYDLYQRYDAIEQIDEKTTKQLEKVYFKRTLEKVWQETIAYCEVNAPDLLERAMNNPKQKMALIFRWYFGHSTRMAMAGEEQSKVDFQIQTGPALGAFNQWVKSSGMQSWRNRHVDEIAIKLLNETQQLLTERFKSMDLC